MENRRTKNGFTLIEIILGVALLAILASFVIVSLNPVGQIGQSRNSQRLANLNTIILGISQNKAENRGTFTCSSGLIPTSTTKMAVGAGNYNIAPCLVPTYLPVMPFDSGAAGAHYASVSDYDTGYAIMQNASGTITLSAPSADFGKTISVSQ